MSENTIFSYTNRDYESARQEGLSKIHVLSKGNWSDLNATDPGIIILDYVHSLVDMINYYQDHQALEVFLPTAKERANIFRLARQLSYTIRSAKGATCKVKFTSPLLYDHIVKIPKYTALRSDTDIPYITVEDAYLPVKAGSVEVNCSQGKYFEQKYRGTGLSRYSNTVGASDQSLILTPTTIDIDSISIVDSLGVTWKRVDNIVFTDKNEKVYQADLNPNNSITIRFGNGERGYIPTETDELTIGYVLTNAEDGRVPANSIIYLDTPILDNGQYVEFVVINESASVGGYNAQSSEEIREVAPGAIKAQNRAVTLSDFENLARSVEGVLSAKAYDINTNPDLCLYHEVKVLVLPESTDTDSDSLKTRVYNYLSQRMIPPTNLQVLTPSEVMIDIDITVKKLSDKESDDSLKYRVQESVIQYFNDRYSEIGEDFYPADLSSTISRIDNVRYVTSISPNNIIKIEGLSVARLGSLSISIQ